MQQAALVLAQDLIKQLANSSFCFKYRVTMVHGSGQISISKCHTAEWRTAQNFAGSRLTIAPEEEPRLWAQIGMSPAIQDNSGDVAPGIEAPLREHLAKLLTDLSFIISKRCSQHLCAAAIPLLFCWSSGV